MRDLIRSLIDQVGNSLTMKSAFAALAALPLTVACVTANSDATEAGKAPSALLGAADPYPVSPINLRRTTLIVRDLEKSLPLYRDALGFNVVYDQVLTSPGLATRYKADGRNRSRLVLTQTNSAEMGMLGLWQFLDQTDLDRAPVAPADFTPGKIVLLFHSKDLQATFARAAKVPGVTVIGPPAERRYPSPAGDIVVLVSMLVDPDGHTIELNQKVFDPRDVK